MLTQTMFFTLITLSLCAHSMAFLSSFKGPKKLGEQPSIDCGRVPPLFWCKSERLAEKCDVSGWFLSFNVIEKVTTFKNWSRVESLTFHFN
jgi:hypothetical protein